MQGFVHHASKTGAPLLTPMTIAHCRLDLTCPAIAQPRPALGLLAYRPLVLVVSFVEQLSAH